VLQASQSPFIAALIPNEKTSTTLGNQFKSQLGTLMDTLNKTSPHFIRCVKRSVVARCVEKACVLSVFAGADGVPWCFLPCSFP
jgi:hypothetical protein